MSDKHTRAWLDEREPDYDRPSAWDERDPGFSVKVPGSYEITLTVSGVKDEHAAYVASQLHTLTRLFKLDGSNVEATVSAERNRDGAERIYELIPDWGAGDDHPF